MMIFAHDLSGPKRMSTALLRGKMLACGSAALSFPTLALAHPGDHGTDWLHAVMHLLTEPGHLAAIVLAAVVAGLWVRSALQRSSSERQDRRDPR
ncbi:MAG: hypothetical protein ACKODB_06800 [Betaproteobacteria bacterium]